MAEDRRNRRQALALAYGEGDGAPRLVAKGYGEVAERIIAEAQRHGVHIHDSPELVGLLMQLDLDAQIPPQLYQVVAELLAWAVRLESVKE
ncbi:flagellar biosynthesis protein [Geopseudomonas sagittaria]|uniref:Flagellar biosynthetic protein FlhB n=1 Tax=Geopseudomonas sagittaria TaxID=1135990 RepID=A0A1I5QFE2_9GAMM|nr:EscU/YscU/HrcU family type III secretion system export apparatus switch protein [Pseudomonas sagittaria]MCM2318435.1 EscU/YscU/HrcU family type III secretion system export apparatus switch protein [Pseudomonas sp.]SFP44566.1 flagellar biosynthesis protein [Pseudomonas sagittaria]